VLSEGQKIGWFGVFFINTSSQILAVAKAMSVFCFSS